MRLGLHILPRQRHHRPAPAPQTGEYEATHLPGLFVAGDASRAVQWVVVAAAEGAEAAFAINTGLLKEDLS